MKILKPGLQPIDWSQHAACICLCEVELSIADLVIHEGDQREESTLSYQCPNCQQRVIIDMHCLPTALRRHVTVAR